VFVRKKRNKSGIISIQVINKLEGKSKLVKTIGSAKDINEIERLVIEGKRFIDSYSGQQILDFCSTDNILKSAFQSISTHTEVGTDLLLGRIFNRDYAIGYIFFL
jgi:hypothetical protein